MTPPSGPTWTLLVVVVGLGALVAVLVVPARHDRSIRRRRRDRHYE